MTDYQNLFESENNEEFELSSEECDVQQIMDCFAKYNETDVYPSAYWDNINLDNQIVPNLEDLSHEHLQTKSPNEERLANGKQGLLSNHQDSKEETKRKCQRIKFIE